ncbi:hypothetical protein CspeluHIS016_0208010 [Cutaneotrichosporon spelunceum]|uniref:Tim44-like domain-containing protein n=1 Tax=Cutaneotrichosporon spelunceum TaxID=1672016 RepID=A0AAD3YA80_9TREE|nr:hypothetical protein CspeluHIS016_0208010 [Cutaneotrichosporon spelunceum]
MSVRPGLLASTSRAALVLARPAPRALSTTPFRGAKEGTVQNIDKEIKNRERVMASLPRGIDITAHFESIILEPIVDPPTWIRLPWILKPVQYYHYTKERVQRDMGTAQMVNALVKEGLVPWVKTSWFSGAGKAMEGIMPEFVERYEAFNRAQASADAKALPTLAAGPALKKAREVASKMQRANASWAIETQHNPPKLQSVRYVPLMGADGPKLAQVCVTFDTTQALTTGPKGKQETKSQRVRENVVFERSNAPNSPWRIKSVLETTWPKLLEGKA